jgi:hypothetical protein
MDDDTRVIGDFNRAEIITGEGIPQCRVHIAEP